MKTKTISAATRAKMAAVKCGPRPSERKCLHCEAAFFPPKISRDDHFCSQKCGYAHRSGERAANYCADMPSSVCPICGTLFRHATKTLPRICCSYSCKAIYQLMRQKTSGTDIERMMMAALDRIGARYQFQFPVARICVADFYLPQVNTLVFCDGDYWHGLPEHKIRDQRQTAALTAKGFRVFRALGSAIKANADDCARTAAEPSFSCS